MLKKIIVALVVLIIAVALVGVYLGTMSKPIDVSSVRSYSDPMTEQLLVSINTGNYTQFSVNFDPSMLNALPIDKFNQLRDTLQSDIGNFTSMTFVSAGWSGDYIAVNYNAIYTNDSNVAVKVVFSPVGDSAKISGLWFNSAKLS